MSKRESSFPHSPHSTKKIKQSNDEDQEGVVVVLLDCSCKSEYLERKMKIVSSSIVKFHSINRFVYPNFIPIEYYHDGDYVLKLLANGQVSTFSLSPKLKNNLQFMEKLIEVCGAFFTELPNEMKSNKEIVKKAMKNYASAYFSVPDELSNDRELATLLIKQAPRMLSFLPRALNCDKELLLIAVQHEQYDGTGLGYSPSEITSDPEVVLQFVKKFPVSLRYASEKLQSDRDFILQCARLNGSVLEFISTDFLNDREIVLECIKNQPGNRLPLLRLVKQFQSDREIVLNNILKSGMAISYSSAELKSDRELVLAAVRKSGMALEYVSSELKYDREIVTEAIRQCGSAIKFSKIELDKELALQAVNQEGNAIYFMDEEFQDDRDIVLASLRNGGSLEYASLALGSDREIVIEALKHDLNNLDYASEELRSDRELVLMAVLEASKRHIVSPEPFFQPFAFATSELQNDKDFVIQVVKIDGSALQFASEELQNDMDVIRNVHIGKIDTASLYSEELKQNREFVKQVAKQNGKLALDFGYGHDKEIVFLALKQDGTVLNQVSVQSKEFSIEAVKQCGYFLDYSKELHFLRLSFAYPGLEDLEKYYH